MNIDIEKFKKIAVPWYQCNDIEEFKKKYIFNHYMHHNSRILPLSTTYNTLDEINDLIERKRKISEKYKKRLNILLENNPTFSSQCDLNELDKQALTKAEKNRDFMLKIFKDRDNNDKIMTFD